MEIVHIFHCTIHTVTGSSGPNSDPVTVSTAQQGWNLLKVPYIETAIILHCQLFQLPILQ